MVKQYFRRLLNICMKYDNLNLSELSAMIGIDLTPNASESEVFCSAISSILQKYWLAINLYSTSVDDIPISPAFILGNSTLLECSKFYFTTDATDPNFTTVEYTMLAIEGSLNNIQGIIDITTQGSRVLVTGTNEKVFSITLFEISEQYDSEYSRDTKTWLLNVSLNEW